MKWTKTPYMLSRRSRRHFHKMTKTPPEKKKEFFTHWPGLRYSTFRELVAMKHAFKNEDTNISSTHSLRQSLTHSLSHSQSCTRCNATSFWWRHFVFYASFMHFKPVWCKSTILQAPIRLFGVLKRFIWDVKFNVGKIGTNPNALAQKVFELRLFEWEA